MPDKIRDKIEARLRKSLDEDLRAATKAIDSGELSELVRNGLRLMLGIRTTKHVEVSERPIQPLTEPQTIRSKPAVFIPNRRN